MENFKNQGKELRELAKTIVMDFMASHPECQPSRKGLKQAEIFRSCGFDWGAKEKATSSNQQYWVVALLRELAEANKVEQVRESGPWRINR
jgi:hypothetical protein